MPGDLGEKSDGGGESEKFLKIKGEMDWLPTNASVEDVAEELYRIYIQISTFPEDRKKQKVVDDILSQEFGIGPREIWATWDQEKQVETPRAIAMREEIKSKLKELS